MLEALKFYGKAELSQGSSAMHSAMKRGLHVDAIPRFAGRRLTGRGDKVLHGVLLTALFGSRCRRWKEEKHRLRGVAMFATMNCEASGGNFVEDIVAKDCALDTYAGRVRTRFPPEPNGYLHIGHAKSICLNFGIAQKFGGACNLRFDDTNPATEKQEYIDSIQADVRWMGFTWDGPERYASDYFGQLHSWAVAFLERGWAYVDELSAEEISEYRGTLTRPGKDSPFRNRPAEENLELFLRMRNGDLEPGKAVLRAKIDMQHRNVIMRDPIMYRIIKDVAHPRTGHAWPIYPSYDWAHGLSDALEEITHSVCTLEFNMHNELYDWFNERVRSLGAASGLPNQALPHQHEFARLEMTHVVVSKRKLKRLVDGGYVEGWNDPRMPTLSGMRRRGYPAAALRRMCELIGVSKNPSTVIEYSLLENCVREVLQEAVSHKLLCVLRPLRVVITNFPPDSAVEELMVPAADGQDQPLRKLPFGREIFIESEDFMEVPSDDFKRLAPGRSAKLRYGYAITCDEVVHGPDGAISFLRCSYDPESVTLKPPKGASVIHWVHATESARLSVRLYDKLFTDPRPEEQEDFLTALNPRSLECLDAFCEPSVLALCEAAVRKPRSFEPQLVAQFERLGYFALDDSPPGAERPIFNRTVTLNDGFKKPEAPARPQRSGKKSK